MTEDEKALIFTVLLLFAGACGVVTDAPHLCMIARSGLWKVVARAAWIVAGVAFAQLLVPAVARRLKPLFGVTPIGGGAENEWPQRVIGIFENIAYPSVLFGCEPAAAATLIVGWVGLKTLGDWEGWKAGPAYWPKQLRDEHAGRRRLYAFMLLNGLQVAIGAAVYWLMPP